MPNVIETTDAAASTATIYTLNVGDTAQGVLSSSSDHDWYRVNLVAGQEIVPEVLQDRVSARELADQTRPLLDPEHPRSVAQRKGLAQVRARLGAPGASSRVVNLVSELLPAGV